MKANSNQIRNLRKQLIELGIPFTDFTNTMVDGTYVQQHENTQKTKEEDLEYFGICLFGNWNKVSELTRKFSLLK